MKDRKFLTGLGVGLIIGALLLQLMNIASSGSGDTVLPRSEDKVYTQEQVDKLIHDAVRQAQTGTNNPS